MNNTTNPIKARRIMLIFSTVAMLFAGIIYAWSILKVPFVTDFEMEAGDLALNFTLTMCFFCIGGLLASFFVKRIGVRPVVIIAGALAGLGFVLTGLISNGSAILLYLTYSLMGGFGIGLAYNAVISTVNAWFPDKKGFCSGCLMMGFGASTLLLGNLADVLFNNEAVGWRMTYVILGVALFLSLLLAGAVLKRPDADTVLPAPSRPIGKKVEDFEAPDRSPIEMLKRFTFWRAFICLICLTAVGNSVISFARDLALSAGAGEFAVTLVGILAVCNGLGRILTGAVFDKLGRRVTMIGANVITIVAAGITLLSLVVQSLPLCVIGLCLTGLSYGSSPTVASAFTSAFYGQKHFAANFGIMNFNLMAASFIATGCTALFTEIGTYVAPLALLLVLSVVALGLNLSIKRP